MRFKTFEREQSRHLNQAAETAGAIRQLIVERDAARREHEERTKQLAAEARKAEDARAQIERQFEARRQVEPTFERRIPELDRELREVNKLYAQLLQIEKQTAQTRQELIKLRERIVAIPNEKSDLRTQHLRAVTEARVLEERLAQQVKTVTAARAESRGCGS